MESMKITPGAGVDPRLMVKPGKRLRNWHRRARNGQSLRQFARTLAATTTFEPHERRTAVRWLAAKGARP